MDTAKLEMFVRAAQLKNITDAAQSLGYTQSDASHMLQALERELRALPDHQREILVMREVSGLSYQEIGELLSLDLGTVKSRLARARLALKKRLLENGNFFTQSASKPSEETKRR